MAGLAAIIVAGGVLGFALSRPPAPPSAPSPPLAPSPLLAQTAPRTAFGFSVADDPAQHEVVLFGGVDSYDQTWLWTGRRWTLAHPPSSPPGRFDAPAAYDPATGQVLIFGRRLSDGELVNDTWAWDGSAWTELDNGTGGGGGGPPGGAEGGAMAWDVTLGAMVLALPAITPGGPSGQTWSWTGARWTRLTGSDFPVGVQPVAAAFDPATSSLLAVGSQASGALGGVLRFVTLEWRGASWTLVPTSTRLDSFAGLAREPISGRLMVAAQNGFPTVPTTSTAWSWTGTDWTLLRGTSGPPWPQAEVTDQNRGRLLLFATLVAASQNVPQSVHVWAWQGMNWHRLDTGD